MQNQVNHSELNKNPFPGLRAFKDSENHLFFGREEHVSDVLAKLDNNHFVAVVGTSGTGKSSLIKAGVLPAITGNKAKLDEDWLIVSANPGSSPIKNLSASICNAKGIVPDENKTEFNKKLIDLMSGSSLGLVQAMRPVLKANTKLLILIDQFEEVFRFADQELESAKSEYDQFVKLIVETIRQRDVPIYAILTLRSDFLGDCVAFEGLPEAINDGHYLVPRMNNVQMKRAITGPIDYAAGKISPRLIQHIANDLSENPDQLPILQHAMMRCWNYWKKNEVAGQPMDLKHFEAIGDLNKALSTHADEAFDDLDESQQLLAEKIFKCLTTKKTDNRGIRRPQSLGSLVKITKRSKEEIIACLAPFQKVGRSFILPGVELEPTESTIYDISHESLMRGWDRLKNWVDEEMESAEFYDRICIAALLYKKGAAALWRDPELQFAVDWLGKQQPIKAWGELYNNNFELGIDFIEESRQANILENARKSRRTQLIRFSVASFIVVISILASWALLQTNIANKKTEEAEVKSQEAIEQKQVAETAREDALVASHEAEASREIAEEQAEIAEEQAGIAESQKKIAESERGKAEASARDAVNKQKLADQKSEEAILEKQKANEARNEALRLRLISTSQNLAHESSQITRDPELAALLAIESFDIASANSGSMNDGTLYEAASKALMALAKDYTPIVKQMPNAVLGLNVKNGELNLVDDKGMFNRYDANTYTLIESVVSLQEPEEINTAYLNPIQDGFAIGLNTFSLNLYGENEKTLTGHSGLIRAVAFRSTNPTLITGGRDAKVMLWDDNGGQSDVVFESRIKSIDALPNAPYCFVGCENGATYKLDLQNKKTTVFATRTNARVETISQTEMGETLAIGYSDGITQIFSISGELEKEVLGVGSVVSIKMSKKNNILAIVSSGRLITVYTLSNLNILPIEIKLDRPIKAMDINKTNGEIYVSCSDRTVHKYPTQTDWYIERLRENVKRELTEDEWSTFIGKDIPYRQVKPQAIN